MHNILSVKRIYSYNVELFTCKYSNGLFPGVWLILFRTCWCSWINTKGASATCVCLFSRNNATTNSYWDYCIWNHALENVDSNWAISSLKKKHSPKNVLVFKWCAMLYESTTFWCINVRMMFALCTSVYTCSSDVCIWYSCALTRVH